MYTCTVWKLKISSTKGLDIPSTVHVHVYSMYICWWIGLDVVTLFRCSLVWVRIPSPRVWTSRSRSASSSSLDIEHSLAAFSSCILDNSLDTSALVTPLDNKPSPVTSTDCPNIDSWGAALWVWSVMDWVWSAVEWVWSGVDWVWSAVEWVWSGVDWVCSAVEWVCSRSFWSHWVLRGAGSVMLNSSRGAEPKCWANKLIFCPLLVVGEHDASWRTDGKPCWARRSGCSGTEPPISLSYSTTFRKTRL